MDNNIVNLPNVLNIFPYLSTKLCNDKLCGHWFEYYFYVLYQGVGLLGLFPLLMQCLKEMTLAKLSAVFRAASYVLLAFSTNTWMVYLGRCPSSYYFHYKNKLITFCMLVHNSTQHYYAEYTAWINQNVSKSMCYQHVLKVIWHEHLSSQEHYCMPCISYNCSKWHYYYTPLEVSLRKNLLNYAHINVKNRKWSTLSP